MEAIKKITNIQNNTLIIPDLDSINNEEVEVIILPLTEKKKPEKSTEYSMNGKLTKYEDPFEPAISSEDWEALK